MPRTVIAGLDGSPESLAAADWAAREALLRAATLRLVHAGDHHPHSYVPFAAEAVPAPDTDLSARMLRETEAILAHRHPGLEITADRAAGLPSAALLSVAREADLLVLGSRRLGGTAGFLLGSVAAAVVARADRPVVLVRAGADLAEEHVPDAFGIASGATVYRDVVLGVDLDDHDDSVLGFAFEEAARRATGLRIVHGWNTASRPVVFAGAVDTTGPGDEAAEPFGHRLTDALAPWRERFPGVEVTGEPVIGRAGSHLTDASRDASLVVIGRRRRHGAFGPRIGPVTHAVLHHAVAPVAVVPHD
jgi:nucleotide-binding universal stress UspA family protein